ncbi:MAG: peptidase S41, partial [Calditrichaeota bacterium]|nr:peptidase S41 [Calditrichota bacterium]
VTIDFENLEDRFIQVTSRGGATRDWILSKDDEIVYFVERNGNLWSTDIRTKRTKKIVEVNAYNLDMTLSNDGKKIYILADRKLIAIDLNSGNKTNLGHPSKINVNTSAERKYIFDHAWRIMREKFYDTNLHGVNWDFYYDAYKKFLPYIANDYDFSEMLSEMMGELNASHAGVSYFPPKSGQSETAELGLYLSVNNKQNGLVVNEVLHGGPFDNATSNVKAGHILEKINDFDLSGKIDISQLLDKKTDKATLFTFFDPVEKVRYEEVVKPISFNSEYSLTKKRWIKKQEEFVKKLSDGRIGYVHISNMLGDGFRKAYAASLSGEKMQEAMIFDIRYNLGGNQHDRLVDLFNGKKYFERINDRVIGPDADEKWNKKSILLVNQGSYSDAHLLAEAYRAFKVGKTIGSPIPGTGTFVWYERQLNWYLSLGIIVMGFQTNDGVYTENKQFSPDILIYNDPNDLVNGVDNQLQKAVEELMKELK